MTGDALLAPTHIELIRFAAYLLHAQARYESGVWNLAFVAVDV